MFTKFGLRPELMKAIEALQFHEPTPVQTEAIPQVLAGRDVLVEGLGDPDWEVRMQAAEALGRIGPAWAIGPVSELVGDPIAGVKNEAVIGLRRIGRPLVVPSLLRALRDEEDPDIGEDAASALAALFGMEAADQLGDLIDAGSARRMENWWRDNANRFDPDRVYDGGQPFSVGRLIDRWMNARPEVTEILSNELFDWTGQRFTGSQRDQASAWEQWWQTNKHAFRTGRRYFHGRDVDEVWGQ